MKRIIPTYAEFINEGIKPSDATEMDDDIVYDLLDIMAQYSSSQHHMSGQTYPTLKSFIQSAGDHIKDKDWKKFQKDVTTKYPKLK